MRKWWPKILGALIIGVGIGLLIIKKREDIGLLNPWNGKLKKEEFRVVGFLPTWMVGKTVNYRKEINELVFLGIEVEETGELVWDVQGKKINNEDYLEIKKEIKKNKGKNILGIKLFEDEKLEKFIESAEARKKLIEELKEVVGGGSFDGVNVDFEYQGDPNWVLSDQFIAFLAQLKQASIGEVSLDVFANTIIKGQKEQIEKLLGTIDGVIVMAYDFHRPGVDFAGPVAPIKSVDNERSISEVTDRIINDSFDRKKIVLAYPLYGYEWKTMKEEFESQVVRGWYQMISWKRAKELVSAEQNLKVNFDEVSMTPWMVWKETVEKSKVERKKVGKKWVKKTVYYDVEEIHQAYYENEESLRAKLQLAKETEVKGVGFWALGYEGEDTTVWEIVKEYVK